MTLSFHYLGHMGLCVGFGLALNVLVLPLLILNERAHYMSAFE
jgi:hypothetical protein